MRYLVTGGAGFIGSHLCQSLLALGHQVRVLDDLSTGHRHNLTSDVMLIEGDVTDPACVAAAVADVDGCFHLAAIASVQRGVTDWLGTHHVNQTGSITLFDAIARYRKVPVVYASSAAVYGDPAMVPITEAAAVAPLSAYGADKYGSELHAKVAYAVHGIPSIGLRFFNVYGPRQDPRSPYSGVISIFCERIRHHRPIEIFGDGEQTRDFIYVADVVAALLAAMTSPPRVAQVLNVCTGIATSVSALAALIAQHANKPLDLRMRPARVGDIKHSVGDPDQANRILGLASPIALRAGIGYLLAELGS